MQNCSSDSTDGSKREARFLRGGSPLPLLVVVVVFVVVAVLSVDDSVLIVVLLFPVAFSPPLPAMIALPVVTDAVVKSLSLLVVVAVVLFRDRREGAEEAEAGVGVDVEPDEADDDVVVVVVVEVDEAFGTEAGVARVASPAVVADVPEEAVPVPASVSVASEGGGPVAGPVSASPVAILLSSLAVDPEELALVLLLTVDDWVPPPPSFMRSLDGVEARESLSLSPLPLPFLLPVFLPLPVLLACSLCTSFWRCTFASLYLRTRFSGTHSSQLGTGRTDNQD